MEEEHEYHEREIKEKPKGGIGIFGVIIAILAVITFFGLVILYLLYFFRNPTYPQYYTVWNTISVSPDAAGSGVATITPGINYIYILTNGVTSVVLNTPTVTNYGGTTFIIKSLVSPLSVSIPITPPPGVTIQKLSIPPGGAATFLWSNNLTTLYVV
jgi:hypothetical protein